MKFDETAALYLFPRKEWDIILFLPPSPLAPHSLLGSGKTAINMGVIHLVNYCFNTYRRSNSARPCLDIQVASWRNPFQGAPCWDVLLLANSWQAWSASMSMLPVFNLLTSWGKGWEGSAKPAAFQQICKVSCQPTEPRGPRGQSIFGFISVLPWKCCAKSCRQGELA